MKMKIDERYLQDIDDEDDDLLDGNQKSANSITFTHWLKVSPRKLMAYPKFDYLKQLYKVIDTIDKGLQFFEPDNIEMTISVKDYDGVYNKKIATEDVLFSGKNIYDDLLAAVLELADQQNPNWREARFQLNHYIYIKTYVKFNGEFERCGYKLFKRDIMRIVDAVDGFIGNILCVAQDSVGENKTVIAFDNGNEEKKFGDNLPFNAWTDKTISVMYIHCFGDDDSNFDRDNNKARLMRKGKVCPLYKILHKLDGIYEDGIKMRFIGFDEDSGGTSERNVYIHMDVDDGVTFSDCVDWYQRRVIDGMSIEEKMQMIMHHGYVSVYTYFVFDEPLDVGGLKDYKANIEDDFNEDDAEGDMFCLFYKIFGIDKDFTKMTNGNKKMRAKSHLVNASRAMSQYREAVDKGLFGRVKKK